MPKRDENGREYIEQDGKRYYRNLLGEWKPEKDIFGRDKVRRTVFGNPKIERDIFGNQKVERNMFGKPYVEPEEDDSGCFLTTACMRAKSDPFDDDCTELTTLRRFRDSYVRQRHPESVAEYYEIAPIIVAEIKGRPNHQEIFETIYNDLVLKALALIAHGKSEEAYDLYRGFTLQLQREFIPDA